MKTMQNLIYSVVAVLTLAIGALTVRAAPGDLFVSINGTGEDGAGFIYQYTPNGVILFASGLSRPRGLAFDRRGNLFVANTTFDDVTQTFQASVVKISPDGVQRTVATLSGNLFGQGMAFDRAGNLFVGVSDGNAPPGPSTIYKFTRDWTQSTFGGFPGWIVGNLVFDSLGNLWVGDAWFQNIYKFTPDGTRSVFVDYHAFNSNDGPVGLALDRLGNVFTSTQDATPTGTDTILKFTPDGVESTFATGLDWPRGLAFDSRGDLFVAQRGAFAPPGDVLQFRRDGNWRVFAPELDDPQYVAFQP